MECTTVVQARSDLAADKVRQLHPAEASGAAKLAVDGWPLAWPLRGYGSLERLIPELRNQVDCEVHISVCYSAWRLEQRRYLACFFHVTPSESGVVDACSSEFNRLILKRCST